MNISLNTYFFLSSRKRIVISFLLIVEIYIMDYFQELSRVGVNRVIGMVIKVLALAIVNEYLNDLITCDLSMSSAVFEILSRVDSESKT